MANGLTRVVVREQNPQVRATNFDEVCYGYNKEEAMEEAARCLNCKKPKCVEGCPVSIDIPAFIAEVKEGNFGKHSRSSASLPHFRQYVVVFVRRRASAKENVSAESKVSRLLSVNWSVS